MVLCTVIFCNGIVFCGSGPLCDGWGISDIYKVLQKNFKVLPHMLGGFLAQEQMVVKSIRLCLTWNNIFFYCLADIPHPAHPHRWRGHRHGGHTWSHCSSVLPASLHHHCWSWQCRFYRHADPGWRRWRPAVTEGRACPEGHCAICPLPRLQNGQCFCFHLSLALCQSVILQTAWHLTAEPQLLHIWIFPLYEVFKPF